MQEAVEHFVQSLLLLLLVVLGTPFVAYYFARSFDGMSVGGSAVLAMGVFAFTMILTIYVGPSSISLLGPVDLILIVVTIILRARRL